jgi:hypothetical protein
LSALTEPSTFFVTVVDDVVFTVVTVPSAAEITIVPEVVLVTVPDVKPPPAPPAGRLPPPAPPG